MIRFDQASFGYNKNQPVIRNLAFEIKQGEKVTLLGLNGSGKSTLLRLAAGLIVPNSGRITVDSISTTDEKTIKKIRSKVGFIFQNPDDQIIATTVEADIAFTLENLAFPREEMLKIVSSQADNFDLTSLLTRHPATLSGGEKQRNAIASVVAPSPQVLLLDEPTSYLDYQGKQKLADMINSDPDLTVLAATQFPSEAGNYKRVLFLDQGLIRFDGSPLKLFESELWQKQAEAITSPSLSKPSQNDTGEQKQGLENVIRIEKLTHSYSPGQQILNRIDLEIKRNQITAVVGESGCGKTTLALLISGLLKVDSGRIVYEQDPAKDETPALCFQFPESQFFADTVLDEVSFGIKERNLSVDELKKSVTDTLAAVGLEFDQFASRNPLTLSGGEKRRVALASTLILDRAIIILDEPTAGLDWLGRQSIIQLLDSLKRSKKTIIVMSHDFDFVSRVADQIILIDNGSIAWSGSKYDPDLPIELFRKHFGELPNAQVRDK